MMDGTFDKGKVVESLDKNATEIQLERLLFGDDDGFYNGLKSHIDAKKATDSTLVAATGTADQEIDWQGEGLEDVNDEEVCLCISRHPC